MVEGEVTRNPIGRAVMQNEVLVFFGNNNRFVAEKPAPRTISAAVPVKNLTTQESLIQIDRASEDDRMAHSKIAGSP